MSRNVEMPGSAATKMALNVELRSGLPGLGDRPSLHPSWGGEPVAQPAVESPSLSPKFLYQSSPERGLENVG